MNKDMAIGIVGAANVVRGVNSQLNGVESINPFKLKVGQLLIAFRDGEMNFWELFGRFSGTKVIMEAAGDLYEMSMGFVDLYRDEINGFFGIEVIPEGGVPDLKGLFKSAKEQFNLLVSENQIAAKTGGIILMSCVAFIVMKELGLLDRVIGFFVENVVNPIRRRIGLTTTVVDDGDSLTIESDRSKDQQIRVSKDKLRRAVGDW